MHIGAGLGYPLPLRCDGMHIGAGLGYPLRCDGMHIGAGLGYPLRCDGMHIGAGLGYPLRCDGMHIGAGLGYPLRCDGMHIKRLHHQRCIISIAYAEDIEAMGIWKIVGYVFKNNLNDSRMRTTRTIYVC